MVGAQFCFMSCQAMSLFRRAFIWNFLPRIDDGFCGKKGVYQENQRTHSFRGASY